MSDTEKTELDEAKKEGEYRDMIRKRLFNPHKSCTWYRVGDFNFDFSDCSVDIVTAVIDLIEEEKAKASGYPNVRLCRNGHDFQLTETGSTRTYYNEDGSVREEVHGDDYKESMVCKKCGVDSHILNHPMIMVGQNRID